VAEVWPQFIYLTIFMAITLGVSVKRMSKRAR
jgi:hypothetical protein